MAVGTTTRLGLTTWGSGSDQFTRVQMNTSHEQLELLAAGYIQQTSLPAAADYKGFFNYSSSGSSAGVLSYSNGDSWFTIGEAAGSVTSVASAPVVGSALAYARADHVHDLTDGVVDADALAIDAVTTDKIVDLNVTTAKIANNNVINSKLAQADATSVIGNATASAATPSYIAAGADGLVLRRASGTLGFGQIVEGSISTGAVTNTKIGSLAVDDSKISDVAASKLTGTINTARISGSYTGITGTGVLAAGSITTTFGNINIGTSTFTGNGSGLTTLNASNLSSGTVANARISGSYTNFTSITASSTITGDKYVSGTGGSAAAPEYTWSGDTNTGMFWDAADSIGFATGGVERMQIGSTYAVFDAGTTGAAAIPTAAAGNSSFPAFTFAGDTNTGMYRANTDQVGITAGGTASATFALGTTFTGIPTASTSGMQAVYHENTFGGLYYFTSVRENKEQITYIDWDVGQIIDSLKPVTFIPKFLPRPDHQVETPEEEALRLADLNYGFVAEDVALVADGKIASWKWDNDELVPAMWKQADFIAILVAEVKALRQRVTALEV